MSKKEKIELDQTSVKNPNYGERNQNGVQQLMNSKSMPILPRVNLPNAANMNNNNVMPVSDKRLNNSRKQNVRDLSDLTNI